MFVARIKCVDIVTDELRNRQHFTLNVENKEWKKHITNRCTGFLLRSAS